MAVAIHATTGSTIYKPGNTTTGTMSITTTVSNCAILVWQFGTEASLPSGLTCSGSTLGAFTKIDAWAGSGGTDSYSQSTLWAAWASSPLTGETITLTQANNYYMAGLGFAVSGLNQTGLVWDAGSPQHCDSGATPTLTTSSADTLLINFNNSGFAQGGAATGFTQLPASDAGETFLFQYKVLSSAGANTISNGYAEDWRINCAITAAMVVGAAGGGGITVDASGGSYAITGTAATIKRGRKTTATSGSYALTGTAATIRHAWKLPAAAGAYTITGTAATLRHVWRLPAASGAYLITGTAATIRKNKPLVAASGSYAVTGTASTIRKGKVLSAAAGSYAISGTAAAIKHSWRVSAAVGSYALTGSDAAITQASSSNKILSSAAGSYSLTGTAATVRHGWNLAAGAGSYAITGTAATVRHGWKIAAAAGSYAITGTVATVRHGWKISAAAGSYALTGTSANITKLTTKTLLADPGSYAITGTAANLKFARRIISGSGSYDITGTAANVSRGRRAIAGGGVYSLTGQSASIIKGQRSLSAQSGSYILTGSSVDLTYFTPNGPRTDHSSRSLSTNISEAQRPDAVSQGDRRNVA